MWSTNPSLSRQLAWSDRRSTGPLLAVLSLAALGCGKEAPTTTEPGASPETHPAVIAQAKVPLSFIQVSAGYGQTCGIATDSLAYCWGDGTTAEELTPHLVAGGLKFIQMGAGSGHVCAVANSQRGYCWGSNLVGQLGNGTNNSSPSPVEVAGNRRWRQIRAGGGYSCGVTTTFVAFCWGNNDHARTGTGVFETNVPLRVLGGLKWRQVVAAVSHTCGITTDDRGYCWGDNSSHQLGDGTTITRGKPTAVAGGLKFERIVPGSGDFVASPLNAPDDAVTCGITTDAKAFCWGSAAPTLATPTPVSGGRLWRAINTGVESRACGVTSSHALFCWRVSGTPARVARELQFSSVSVSTIGTQACALTTDKKAYCWEGNGTPVPVGPPA